MDTKALMFLIYSAGYEAGYGGKVDLAESFRRWYDALQSETNLDVSEVT